MNGVIARTILTIQGSRRARIGRGNGKDSKALAPLEQIHLAFVNSHSCEELRLLGSLQELRPGRRLGSHLGGRIISDCKHDTLQGLRITDFIGPRCVGYHLWDVGLMNIYVGRLLIYL